MSGTGRRRRGSQGLDALDRCLSRYSFTLLTATRDLKEGEEGLRVSREEAVVHPPGRRKGGKGKEEEKILERKGGIVFVCVCFKGKLINTELSGF